MIQDIRGYSLLDFAFRDICAVGLYASNSAMNESSAAHFGCSTMRISQGIDLSLKLLRNMTV